MESRFEIKFHQKALLYDFSGAVEQGWKIIKYYLEYVNGLDDLGNQSKKIIRAGKDDGLYNEAIADSLMEMIDLRNVLAHEYDYENINSKCQRIQSFMSTVEDLYTIINNLRIQYAKYWEKDTVDL